MFFLHILRHAMGLFGKSPNQCSWEWNWKEIHPQCKLPFNLFWTSIMLFCKLRQELFLCPHILLFHSAQCTVSHYSLMLHAIHVTCPTSQDVFASSNRSSLRYHAPLVVCSTHPFFSFFTQNYQPIQCNSHNPLLKSSNLTQLTQLGRVTSVKSQQGLPLT